MEVFMNFETKVIMAAREETLGRKSLPGRPALILFVYDTAWAQRDNEEYMKAYRQEKPRLKLPAKYGVGLHHQRWTDAGIIAASFLNGDEGNNKAIWFDRFSDLPFAVQALRERFPKIPIPEQVNYVIDWPFDRRKGEPGSTLVATPLAANDQLISPYRE